MYAIRSYYGWAQGTFASKVEKDGGALNVTREIDGGLQTIKIIRKGMIEWGYKAQP